MLWKKREKSGKKNQIKKEWQKVKREKESKIQKFQLDRKISEACVLFNLGAEVQ